MPTDRVLIEIVTAANMAGVQQAKAGLLGLNPSTFALGATLGGVVVIGKQAVDVARRHATAEGNLQQAIKARGVDSKAVTDQLHDFIGKNLDVISSQEDVTDATAALIREGVPLVNLNRDLTLIVDLAAAKHKTLSEATDLVTAAEAGQFKGLKSLLGLQVESISKSDTLADKQKAVNQNLDAAAASVKGVARASDTLTSSTTEMSNHWHDFLVGPGKQLTDALTAGVGIANLFITMLGEQGFWDQLDRNVVGIANTFQQWLSVVNPILAGLNLIHDLGGMTPNTSAHSQMPQRPTGTYPHTSSVVVNVNGATSPQVTSQAVVRALRAGLTP